MLFLLNIYIKQRFNGGHLGFHDGRYEYKVENISVQFLTSKMYVYTLKSCFHYI